jgi:hypothetical protein
MTKDITGQRFAMLTAVERVPGSHGRWLFRCDCGTVKSIRCCHVTGGKTLSCGCRPRGTTATHGMSVSPEYYSWSHMRQRCENPANPKYHRYGARGIRVCPEWASFEAFYADMGPKPPGTTLDREDNDGNYEPGNCRWATAEQQANNRSIVIPAGGYASLKQMARREGVAYLNLYYHVVKMGRDPVAALAFLRRDATAVPST